MPSAAYHVVEAMIQEAAEPQHIDPGAIMGQGIRIAVLLDVRNRILRYEMRALEIEMAAKQLLDTQANDLIPSAL